MNMAAAHIRLVPSMVDRLWCAELASTLHNRYVRRDRDAGVLAR
jgi:hypothetical protein